jgi:nitrogen fixation/metabolism regulation signal transduction histidine kinase
VSTLRARLLTAFALVAVLPVALLAIASSALIARSFQESAERRLDQALAAGLARMADLRAEAEARVEAVVREDLADAPASRERDRELATQLAQRRGLAALEIVDGSGLVISSHHWSAGFGLPGRDVAFPDDAVLRVVTVAEGYGAAENLALMPSRQGRWRGAPVTVRGGSLLDTAFLAGLDALMGVRTALYDAWRGRWVVAPGASFPALDPPLLARSPSQGEATLDGVPYRWAAGRAAPSLWLAVAAPRTEELALARRVERSTLAAGAAALLAALLTAVLLASGIARPVRELADAARRLASGERADTSLITSRGELGELAAAFSALGADLEASRARLVQAERVAAWREMARRLAHELKNPLFPIQLSLETLRRAADAPPGRAGRPFQELFRETSDTMLEALGSLRRVVDEFSEFARLPRPRFEPTDLNELARQVLALYRPRAGKVRVEERLDPELPSVPADRDLIARALGNLVANALDAMPAGGTLTLRSRAEAGHARLEVEDSGPGIADDDRKRLFTPYYTTRPGGTGLGLAIVQGIAADHQGRVELRSEPGRGATFTIVLPLNPRRTQS